MENYTFNSFTLQLEGLKVSEVSKYPIFFFSLFSYILIMTSNIGIVVLVFIDKNLHHPMYLLFCNLPFNDVVGNSIMMPRLLSDILLPPSARLISYHECLIQAFTTHMYGTTSHTVLMIMAFDRYVDFDHKPFCDNASLFKLSCDSVVINNVYGLTFTVVLFTGSIGTIVLTYTQIMVVCVTSKNTSLNSKALKTCSTHLLVYMIMLFTGILVIALHRFPQYSDYRKMCAILFHIIPGSLNPIIYGVQSKRYKIPFKAVAL
uniref:G-protein coupled receptors family 1 profile domain-containing protein n=1 Tax=Oreochromis aureus TaxID=47969 RepID=A0AAZ1XQT4_OREAU